MKTFVFVLFLTCAAVPGSYGQTVTFTGEDGQERKHVLAPDAFGKLVALQVSEMYREGYFSALGKDDLYHGHLVYPARSPQEYASLEDMLAHVALTLYHTDESTTVWDSEGSLYPGVRRQRSIVGLPDGRIRPAIDFFSVPYKKFDHYAGYGTIHPTDFERFMPEQFERYRDIHVISEAGRQRFGDAFMIHKTAGGRYEIGGIRYDVYIIVVV